MTSRAHCVGVWGHYYGANLGDDLVARVIVEAVRRRDPSSEVRGFSLDPTDTERRHGIRAWPITSYPDNDRGRAATGGGGRFSHLAAGLLRRAGSLWREAPHLARSYWALRPVDLLVVAGSGQLLDTWSGAWGHPYTLFKWSLLARLTGTRMAFLSVGAGPIESRLARWFIRWAVEAGSEVTVRDVHSAQVLRDIGVRRSLEVVPDMGFGLEAAEVAEVAEVDGKPEVDGKAEVDAAEDGGAASQPAGGASARPMHAGRGVRPFEGLTVGVNAMAHAHARYWGRGDEGRYDVYLDKMAAVVRRLVEGGARVVLFSSQVRADPQTAEDLLARLGAAGVPVVGRGAEDVAGVAGVAGAGCRVVYRPVREVDDLVRVVRGCDYVIATRYHSVLLPLLMGIPTMGLAYHPKTVHLMAAAGQGAYCLDIDSFTETQLMTRFGDLCRKRTSAVHRLREGIPALSGAVRSQFDHVLFTSGTFVGSSAVAREEPTGR
ncbi:MAG: polysaccharide pyruvyl transferase family protein [Dehalococcoidia bacterium]|nr:polysaccharide pyruvyl transferase family protein [Dehalococcoidia bacterium]